MTARDDYPCLGWHSVNHDRTNLGEQLMKALDEIDELRHKVNYLRFLLTDATQSLIMAQRAREWPTRTLEGPG